jgi:CheY-like chemotaxis protein
MNKLGPIIVIDNDLDDLDLIGDALESIKANNKIILFSRPTEFLKYMREKDELPFFILCDINMPNMDGIELFKFISTDPLLAAKCFPFLFFSTSACYKQISSAYELHIQGYFKKPSTFEGLISMLEGIIAYWDNSFHPAITDKLASMKVDEAII